MGEKEDNKKLDQVEKNGKIGRSSKMVYICLSVVFIVGIGVCLYYIVDQTLNKAFWSVVSEEEIKKESFFNRDCSEVLENLQNGLIDINDMKNKMSGYMQTGHGKIFISGIEAFSKIQEKVKNKEKIEFLELIKTNDKLRSFSNYFASNKSTKKEMLYPAFLASDIIAYIFNHRNIIDIHLEDRILSDSDEECLTRFYELAFSVFDYQKNLFNLHYDKSEFYQNTSTFDLLALTLYSKAMTATKGKNDKSKIDEILTTISENDFKVTGEKNRWYTWLKKDLKKIKERTFRYKIENRPPNVNGRWLI